MQAGSCSITEHREYMVSETGCVFCTVVTALQRADSYRFPDSGDTFRKIQELPASIVVLMPDQYYTGYTLVISKTHATELFHLSESESTQYLNDMLQVANALDAVFHPRKLNYQLLGNTVAHLHWHLVPRYDCDPHPKRPIWEHSHTPNLLSPEAYDARIVAIRQHLS